MVPWFCLQRMIGVFLDHTDLSSGCFKANLVASSEAN